MVKIDLKTGRTPETRRYFVSFSFCVGYGGPHESHEKGSRPERI